MVGVVDGVDDVGVGVVGVVVVAAVVVVEEVVDGGSFLAHPPPLVG